MSLFADDILLYFLYIIFQLVVDLFLHHFDTFTMFLLFPIVGAVNAPSVIR